MTDEQKHENSDEKLNDPLLDEEAQSPTSDKKKSKEPVALVPVGHLFRYCDSTDKLLIFLGVIGAIFYGTITPAQFILYGTVTDDFVDFVLCEKNPNCTDPPDLEGAVTTIAYWYIGFSVANFVFAWMAMGLFGLSAERQIHQMRLAMFRNIIHQEIGWFDAHSSGELSTRLTEDLNKIADGIGSKFGRLISCLASFIAGYIIAFVYGWKLTLVMLAVFPVNVVVGSIMAKVTGDYTAKELEAYAKAGHVAEQTISSIRTVEAFGGEQKQVELYDKHLLDASNFGLKKGFTMGAGMGVWQLAAFLNMALSFWFIVKLVRDGESTPGDGMTVFFAVTMASMVLGQAGPSGEALAAARGAGVAVLSIIDRKSEIDASSDSGLKPENVSGDVEFSHIEFVYPTRSSVQVLHDFNLKVSGGKRVALVGESGCGKSTIVKLIQRFYDPVKGSVLLDGLDIKDINVNHLRRLIGVVNQEPVLFATTIAENIAYGREGVTQEEIEKAAKMANAHEFITCFPQGYNTLCGERGAKMSGGQKQRIAIARALVRNPKILLLDEATSALDTESEAVVQDALDRAGEGRTTIIVAHRLSTIKNADLIVAVSEGRVAEMGTHDELMALEGVYNSLVKLQEGEEDDKDEEDENDNENEVDDEMAGETENSKKLGHHKIGGALQLGSVATLVSEYQPLTTQGEGDTMKPVSFWRILKMNAPEWKYLLLGCFGAAIFGCYPFTYAIAFGAVYGVISNNASIPEQNEIMKDDSAKLAIFFIIIGLVSGIGVFLQNWSLGKAGETLTKRLRKNAFLAFLRQEISFYDNPSNGTGSICTRLAVEVSSIKGATGAQLGLITVAVIATVGGAVVSFLATWQLTLVMLAFVPFLMIAGMTMTVFLGGGSKAVTETDAGQAAEEILSNIQTVASLGREDRFFERYRQALMGPYRIAKRNSHVAGLTAGSFFGIANFSFAAAFRYGGYLITKGDLTLQDVITALNTVVSCTVVIGATASLTPDYAKAKEAVKRLFHLFKQIPHIDSSSNEGRRPETCTGEVELSNVRFRYPTRRNHKVLRNLSFTIKPGQTVALVGTSGCGKSTSMSLVERFYDVNSGSVKVDGNDVKELNVKWLRSQIGIVSQEPVLFDLSIRDNIAYGDTTRNVSNKEIEEAARSANIHEFISGLPQGYDTVVGDKGTLISGGQKQRIAIARALIRDPKILLLDEATSALDTESEKVVQQALDMARVGRTTLIIAHRLSTIQNADVIVVMKNGRAVEHGTHQQLLALKGIYHALYHAQSLATAQS